MRCYRDCDRGLRQLYGSWRRLGARNLRFHHVWFGRLGARNFRFHHVWFGRLGLRHFWLGLGLRGRFRRKLRNGAHDECLRRQWHENAHEH